MSSAENTFIKPSKKEYCGITGIIGKMPNLFNKTYLTLFSLQHRGQESAGISIYDGRHFHTYKKQGFVRNLLDVKSIEKEGEIAIGHVRYSTTGDSEISNAQPIFARTNFGKISISHNGNFVNFKILRNMLQDKGAIFQGNSDSELIVHDLAMQDGDFEERLIKTLNSIKGAYSLVVMRDDALYGIRDPHGYRPLVYGKIPGGYIITSESCAINILEGEYMGEVEEGTILKISKNGKIEKIPFAKNQIKQNCVFEHVYFARPDSLIFGKNVHKMRYKMGEKLAEEYKHLKFDLVIAVPDSGLSSALGFSQASGIRLDRGLIRNHYVGRSFINPTPEERKNAVKMKLRAVREVIKGQDLAVVDDSMVRSTTARGIVKLLKQKGAGRIHYFLACPPIKHPCYFGVDIPDRKQLIANKMTPEQIAEELGIASVNYLSIKGLKEIMRDTKEESHCYNCFLGDYKIELEDLHFANML